MDYNNNQTNSFSSGQNSASEPTRIYTSPNPKKEGGVGPVIGSIIIIILIILGGLYFWGYIVSKEESRVPVEENNTEEDADINSIEAELNSTEFNQDEEELNQIDAEIDAAFE